MSKSEQPNGQQPKNMTPEREQQVRDLIDGKKEPPNGVVAYLVGELRTLTTEKVEVMKTVRQAEEILSVGRKRLIELNGIGQKYFEDIAKHLDAEDTDPRKRLVVPAQLVPKH